jgi:hypothetical protein
MTEVHDEGTGGDYQGRVARLRKTGRSARTYGAGGPFEDYVGHCDNLSHEDHAMMFAWEITP